MKTLAKLAISCKRNSRPFPQGEAAAGHHDQATAYLTGSPTWDLNAWPPSPGVSPGKISLPAKRGSHYAGNQSPVWRVLDCRHSVYGRFQCTSLSELRNPHATNRTLLHLSGMRRKHRLWLIQAAGGSPTVPPPCGKDVRTRSGCRRGFCAGGVYLYPQITVRRATRARGLLLPFLGGIS